MSKKVGRVPEAELDIMIILWRTAKPMKVSDICSNLQSYRKCSKAAVHTLIDRLSKRGFVKIEHVEASLPYKLIHPIVTEEEYRALESETLIEKLCRGKWQPLIASLYDSGKLTQNDIDEIAAMLNGKDK